MKRVLTSLFLVYVLLLPSAPAPAQMDVVQTVLQGCKSELQSHCQTVTPGGGRLLACLYAHGEKLSGRCEFALYDAAVQLERAVAALTFVANECGADLKTHCASVATGEGRLLACLKQNESQVSQRCKQAVKDVGLR